MIFAMYNCIPGRRHPDFEQVGEAFVSCFLRVRSFSEARALAERSIRSRHWKSLSLNEIWRIPRGHFQTEHDGLPYYEQALIDREVYVFNVSPKYPVYCVEFEAVPMKTNAHFPQGTHARVMYWIVNEKVSPSSDPYDDFWGKVGHKQKAVSMGRKMIHSEKWRVVAVRGGKPVNQRSFPKDHLLTQYYEEAEEYGECIAFWVE